MGIRNAIFIIALLTFVIILIMATAANAQECEITQFDSWVCSGNIGVVQFGLDELEQNTLWSIYQAKLNGTYVYPEIIIAPGPIPIPFAYLDVTSEDLIQEANIAQNTICTSSLYGSAYKEQQGCIMGNDGKYS
jgi:hypothetical protein